MASKHIVKSGECLASIARLYGFVNPMVLWDSPDNDALKKKRKNPDILYPGDEVAIPDKRPHDVSVGKGKSASLKLNAAVTKLSLKVLDNHTRECSAERSGLTVGGVKDRFEDKLTPAGEIDVEIPALSKRAPLQIFAKDVTDPIREFDLTLGELDPLDTVAGVQARL